MRYRITCCKNCEFRQPGCNCLEFRKQKAEFTETKEIGNKAKLIFHEVSTVIWSSEKHYGRY